jgi:hypothetical protein
MPYDAQKCDGEKPICGPCSRYPTAFSDCEYTEDGPAYSQMLEGEENSIFIRCCGTNFRRTNFNSTRSNRGIGGPAPDSVLRPIIKTFHQLCPNTTDIPHQYHGLGTSSDAFLYAIPISIRFFQTGLSDLQQTSGHSINPTAATSMPTVRSEPKSTVTKTHLFSILKELPFIVLQAL